MCTVQVKIIIAFPFPGVREISRSAGSITNCKFEFTIVTGLQREYTAGFGICFAEKHIFSKTIDR